MGAAVDKLKDGVPNKTQILQMDSGIYRND